MNLEIRDAVEAADVEQIRRLFEEYQRAIDVDLCFQGFAEELASLPGKYARPGGRLLLAVGDRESAGCAGLRPLGGRDCEMKRLYVRPPYRGSGLGRRLATELVDHARGAGYARMYLDTLSSMTEARALYRSLAFVETAPYYPNPEPGAIYLALDL